MQPRRQSSRSCWRRRANLTVAAPCSDRIRCGIAAGGGWWQGFLALYLDAALEQAKEAGRTAPAGCSEDESFHFVNTSQSSLCSTQIPGCGTAKAVGLTALPLNPKFEGVSSRNRSISAQTYIF